MSKWKTKKWFVSHYNFAPEALKGLKLPKKIEVHDVTLRDGEQQANIIFWKDEKLRIARKLSEAGVSRIEAGMPAVSSQDLEAVKTVAHEGLDSKVFAFCRCMKRDVDLALSCDVDGVVMEIPSSDHVLKYAYGWSEQKAIDLSVEATSYAREHGLYTAFFTIDATRATFASFWRLVNGVATRGHMDSLVVADTFGVCTPHAIAHFVRLIRKRIRKPIEIHCHNDFGLAVSNTVAALAAGASTVHTTVNSIGERMGNASLEQTVMALKILYGVETGVRMDKLRELAKLVEECSGLRMPPNAPVVGDNIFTTESGIVAGWWSRLEDLNMPLEMLPFTPELVNHEPFKVVIGKKSGRESIMYAAKKLGVSVTDEKIDEILPRVKEKSIQMKRALTNDEVLALLV